MIHLLRDFPNSTPGVKLLITIQHSHVFGDNICLSLLRAFESHFSGMPETVFWNPSRSIRSLLESVYVFLTVNEDRFGRYSKYATDAALNQARQCRCLGCGHQPSRGMVWPAEEHWLAARVGSAAALSTGNSSEAAVCALAMHEDITTAATKRPPKPAPPKTEVTASERLATIRPVVADINTPTKVECKVEKKKTEDPSIEDRLALLKVKADEMVTIASHESPVGLVEEAFQEFPMFFEWGIF